MTVAMATVPLVRVRNAAFGYNSRAVLRDASFEVMEGEFIGLIGPNGAGKSTLFKGMLKLIPALAGGVWHDASLKRRIGFVPQRDVLDGIYPLSVFNVAQMGIVGIRPWYRMTTAAMNAQVRACLEQVGMADKERALFAELSGGQRQRVLIARALAMDPKLMVLDEPTAGIDPVAEEAILRLLGQLNRERKLTILMVSHHIHSLRESVQRAILIKKNSVLCGSAEELLHPDKIDEILG
jgi:ABC-type Mn2+/Zn2+ transport system ATPase subunit